MIGCVVFHDGGRQIIGSSHVSEAATRKTDIAGTNAMKLNDFCFVCVCVFSSFFCVRVVKTFAKSSECDRGLYCMYVSI